MTESVSFRYLMGLSLILAANCGTLAANGASTDEKTAAAVDPNSQEPSPVPADVTVSGQSAPSTEQSSSSVQPLPAAAAALTDEEVLSLIQQLSVDDFTVRQEASQKLKSVSIPQMRILAEAAETSPDDEVCSRLATLLEVFFTSNNSARVSGVSELIEEAAHSSRWMLAEEAAKILYEHWEQRFVLVKKELEQLGVSFSESDSGTLLNGRIIINDQPVPRVHIDKDWTGGERGVELLLRLSQMTGSSNQGSAIALGIYLLDGHPLSQDQQTQLKRAFGDRLIERGRVCLGITNDILFPDEKGCRVGNVTQGSSASDAGLLPGDIILQVEDTPIRDFQHLVETLRKYDVGDTVNMKIERGDSPYGRRPDLFRIPRIEDAPEEKSEAKIQDVKVPLKGWD